MAEGSLPECHDKDSIGFLVSNFVGTVDDSLICLICHNVVDDPAECPCGHLFCGPHIKTWLDRARSCPSCREPCDEIKQGQQIHLSYRRMLSELRVKCDYHSLGCTQVLHPKDLRAHCGSCEFTPAFCRWDECMYNAKAKRTEGMQYLNQKMLAEHERSCDFRLVLCDLPGCGEVLPFNKQTAHSRICRTTMIDCTIKGCNTRLPRGSFRPHFEDPAVMVHHVFLLSAEVARLTVECDRPELVHDDVVVFRVTDVAKKFESTSFRFETKMYTLPMLGRQGYNFRVQLRKREWPDDRRKFNDRLGVYLHIEQGEIDDLLSWPFPFHYAFTILDQSPEKRHIEFSVTDGASRGADWLGPGTGKGWGPQGIASFDTLRSRGYCNKDVMYVMIKFARGST